MSHGGETTIEPIRHEYRVPCSAAHAFDTYARRMGEWWDPAYTAGPDTFESVTIEPREGGKVVEHHRDGRRFAWGEVREWDPGQGLTYTSTLAQTPEYPGRISVRFEEDRAGCRIRFEHGGWNEGNAADRAKFTDWPALLSRFVELAVLSSPNACGGLRPPSPRGTTPRRSRRS